MPRERKNAGPSERTGDVKDTEASVGPVQSSFRRVTTKSRGCLTSANLLCVRVINQRGVLGFKKCVANVQSAALKGKFVFTKVKAAIVDCDDDSTLQGDRSQNIVTRGDNIAQGKASTRSGPSDSNVQ